MFTYTHSPAYRARKRHTVANELEVAEGLETSVLLSPHWSCMSWISVFQLLAEASQLVRKVHVVKYC